MGLKAKILPNYTYEDYCQWEGRWEVIEGIPYAMSPMPSPKHQNIAGNIHAEFRDALKRNNCDCKVYQPIDIKTADNTIVNPDVIIVCKPIEKQYLDFPPAIVVEILSPSTHLKDKNTKYDLYQDFGIRYYLIIDPDKETIEIYKLDEEGKYQLVNDEEFQLTDKCAIKPDFKSIW